MTDTSCLILLLSILLTMIREIKAHVIATAKYGPEKQLIIRAKLHSLDQIEPCGNVGFYCKFILSQTVQPHVTLDCVHGSCVQEQNDLYSICIIAKNSLCSNQF